MSKALHPAVPDRIAAADEDDGNGMGQLLRCSFCSIAVSQHHIRRLAQQLRGGGAHPIGVARPPVIIDLKISADSPAELLALEATKSWSPRVVSRLETLLRSGADEALYRINPIQFASSAAS